jgi:hypothetical protein
MEAAALMDWLVDTNILIDHLRGVSKATTFLRQARGAGTLWISAVTETLINVWLTEKLTESVQPKQ